MQEKYLIINAGSSSLKFSLYEMPDAREIVNGYVEKIGSDDSFYTLKFNGTKLEKKKIIKNHKDAVDSMLHELFSNNFISDLSEIKGVGHRVLHGGEFYSNSVIIDDEVLNNIKSLSKFGPLHHPGEIAGIESMQDLLPGIPEVAVFDTAFHQTMPKENYMYAVPFEWYLNYGVRKYGFHGTSHKYITQYMQNELHKDDINLIICHIGSGASMCCVKDGKCFNTTMGLTPLDGLIMGTRCGSIDSSIIEFICKEKNLTVEEVLTILNKQSGLLGICGKNDFRDVEKLANNNDERGILASNMLRDSIIKYIAEYYFLLQGKVDALVFTAGLGENAISLRKDIINNISSVMGITLNEEENEKIAKFKNIQTGIITSPDSKFPVFVIPTNEEYMILKDTYELSKIKQITKTRVKVK